MWLVPPAAEDDVSFSASDEARLALWRAVLPADIVVAASHLSLAEAELAEREAALAEAADQFELIASADALDFGLSEQVADAGGVIMAQVSARIDLLMRTVRQSGAAVQTEVDGELLARSLLGWNGNQRTVWSAHCTPEQAALHHRAVDLAINSRAHLLKTIGVVLGTAARAATLLTLPGAPVLVVPALARLIATAL